MSYLVHQSWKPIVATYDFLPSPITNPLRSSPIGCNYFQLSSIPSHSSLVITSQPLSASIVIVALPQSHRRCYTATISVQEIARELTIQGKQPLSDTIHRILWPQINCLFGWFYWIE